MNSLTDLVYARNFYQEIIIGVGLMLRSEIENSTECVKYELGDFI